MAEIVSGDNDVTHKKKRKKNTKEDKKSKKAKLTHTTGDSAMLECENDPAEIVDKQKKKHKKHKKSHVDSCEVDDSPDEPISSENVPDMQIKKKHKKSKKSHKDTNALSENDICKAEENDSGVFSAPSELTENDKQDNESNKKDGSETATSDKQRKKKCKNDKKSKKDIPESDDVQNGEETGKSSGDHLEGDAKDENSDLEEDPEKAAIREKKRAKRRQKKLEKLKEKQEREARAGTGKKSAIEYLNLWNTNRAEWKFMKVRQVWCLQNTFDTEQVSDDMFEILLRYLKPLSGNAKTSTLAEAEKIIKQAEEDTTEDGDLADKADRARQIIQLLSD